MRVIESKADAAKLIRELSRDFQVPMPRLIWSTRTTHGQAQRYYTGAVKQYYGQATMKIGHRCWRGILPSLVHEFAHILVYHRDPPKQHHNARFYLKLVAVAQSVYGRTSDYPWATEYRTIRSRAKRDGFLTATNELIVDVAAGAGA